jgi:GAF domain-containing protein
VLELAIGDAPLETTLTALIRIVEESSKTGVLGSILLLDSEGKHLSRGAAPSLPAEYCALIDGLEIGACAGSCGTAAYHGAAVFVSDIATDPLWADYNQFALPHGLRACWSTPVFDEQRNVIATFAIYHLAPGTPSKDEINQIQTITESVARAISWSKSKQEPAPDEAPQKPPLKLV